MYVHTHVHTCKSTHIQVWYQEKTDELQTDSGPFPIKNWQCTDHFGATTQKFSTTDGRLTDAK